MTPAAPQTDTNSVDPSGDTTQVYGSAGNWTVRTTRPLARSTALNVWPTTSTAKSRLPSGLTARPPIRFRDVGFIMSSHWIAGSNGRPITRSTDRVS